MNAGNNMGAGAKPRISPKDLAEMANNPGGAHTTHSLAELACLSRSAFMARFTAALEESPMTILRDLRMRQAAEQLKTDQLSVEQIAAKAGYESRSSFVRAFRLAYGEIPQNFVERCTPNLLAQIPPAVRP